MNPNLPFIPFAQARDFFLGRPQVAQAAEPGVIPFSQARQFFLSGGPKRPTTGSLPRIGTVSPTAASTDRSGIQQMIAQTGAQVFGEQEVPALLEIVKRESGFNPVAQNPKSTAFGLFQFLDSTWQGTGIPKTEDPNSQIAAGLQYIKNRYGSPTKALSFHNKKGYY